MCQCNCQSIPQKAAPGELPVVAPMPYRPVFGWCGTPKMTAPSGSGSGMGIFLFCLGVLGGGFGLAIASPALVVKGGFCILAGLVRIATS